MTGPKPTLTTLASFKGLDISAFPAVGLIMGGDLIGTTQYGGAAGGGTIFVLSRDAGTVTTLASFAPGRWSTSGAPSALVADIGGNLFGITGGDGWEDYGAVLVLPKGSGKLITLASFTGSNGAGPNDVFADAHGHLFGTTSAGGAADAGTVWMLAKGSNTITALASFTGADGDAGPIGGVVADAESNLFGVTWKHVTYGRGFGAVFTLPKGLGTITTLARFRQAGDGGNDVNSHLVMDAAGDLFGSTRRGGLDDAGSVFMLARGSRTITTVASFMYDRGVGSDQDRTFGPDGACPGWLIADADGNLFGMTDHGGGIPNADGTVFMLAKSSHSISTILSCRRLPSSRLVLANSADSCSD